MIYLPLDKLIEQRSLPRGAARDAADDPRMEDGSADRVATTRAPGRSD